jgi:ankyrin repeat protein
VKKLVLAGVDVDLPDPNGKTALSLALVIGDIISMMAILDAKTDPTDGMLHDAALLLNSEAVKILYGYGYDPNETSLRHGGRSPLAELCYRGPDPSFQLKSEQRIRNTMTALVEGGAHTDIMTVADDFEKSLLILALDTREPYFMASAFLNCDKAQQGMRVNEVFNLYNNSQYTYSPIMYVEKGLWKGERDQYQTVLNLLRKWKVERRFWKNSGEQPFDMVGAPPHIAAVELERKAYERKKALKQRELNDAWHFEEMEANRRLDMREREREVEKKIQEDQVQTALMLRQKETQGVIDLRRVEHEFDMKLKHSVHQVELKLIQETQNEEARGRQRQIEDQRKRRAIEDSAIEKQITLIKEQKREAEARN